MREPSAPEQGQPDSRLKAFGRAATELQARGLIGKAGKLVWLAQSFGEPDKPDKPDICPGRPGPEAGQTGHHPFRDVLSVRVSVPVEANEDITLPAEESFSPEAWGVVP